MGSIVLNPRQAFRGSLVLASMLLLAGCALASFASQRPKPLPKIGALCLVCPPVSDGSVPPVANASAFVEGLRELGYVDGETISILWRGAGGQNERLAPLAEDLVKQQVDVIVTMGGSPAAAAARQATTSIPIIFVGVGDPVSSGFVASYAHPGGNVTGLSNYLPETIVKRLEHLKEAVPGISRVGALCNFANPATPREWQEAREAAGRLGLTLQPWDVRTFADVEATFQAAAGAPPDALFVSGEPFLSAYRMRLLELVAERRLPASYNVREWVADGGLISYGFNLPALHRRTAIYVDGILKGASPADLPVELPTAFDFAVNLKTAHSLGLTIPQSVLQQTSEIIQ